MKFMHPQFLDVKRSLLLIVDVQDKLFGVMKEEGKRNLRRNIPILLAAARELDLPVIVTEQYPKGLGPTIPEIGGILQGVPVIEKIHFAATEEETFVKELSEAVRTEIILVGMETHICVYQTALGLLKQGYEIHAVADALTSRDPVNHTVGLQLLERAGCFVTTTECALFQLLEQAGTESFKKLQKLII